MRPIISVDKLTKKFGSFAAVNQISFEVYPGEIFGFLGANGAGAVENNIRTSNLLRPYSLLYWLEPTDKRYVFPMISQPPVNKVHNDFGDKKQ